MTENGMEQIFEQDEVPILEFENVGFTYEGAGEESLSNIDFEVFKGETVGIIGGTGSGKTTLVNLIPRFYDATSGLIRYHGKPIGDYKMEEIRGRIGIVPQKAVLFKGTVKSYLFWGKDNATVEEMEDALKASQSLEFVEKLDQYLDVGESKTYTIILWVDETGSAQNDQGGKFAGTVRFTTEGNSTGVTGDLTA